MRHNSASRHGDRPWFDVRLGGLAERVCPDLLFLLGLRLKRADDPPWLRKNGLNWVGLLGRMQNMQYQYYTFCRCVIVGLAPDVCVSGPVADAPGWSFCESRPGGA